MIYVGASAVCGLAVPRLEQAYLPSYTFNVSVSSAQAYLSATASGMMALTGVVFAMAFVMVQFSAIDQIEDLLGRCKQHNPLKKIVPADCYTEQAWQLGHGDRQAGAALNPTRMLSLISFTSALKRSNQANRQSAATVKAVRLATWA
jgi:hypothetical protein